VLIISIFTLVYKLEFLFLVIIVNIPILREIFNYLSRYGNMFILNQDRPVVITQKP
jgi:hypothetical protein